MGGTTEPTTAPPVVVSQPSFLDSIDWGTKLASNEVKVYFAVNGEVFDGKVDFKLALDAVAALTLADFSF